MCLLFCNVIVYSTENNSLHKVESIAVYCFILTLNSDLMLHITEVTKGRCHLVITVVNYQL